MVTEGLRYCRALFQSLCEGTFGCFGCYCVPFQTNRRMIAPAFLYSTRFHVLFDLSVGCESLVCSVVAFVCVFHVMFG